MTANLRNAMTAASKMPNRAADRKWLRPSRIAILTLGIGLIFLLVWLAVRPRPINLSDTEKDILRKLDEYEAKYELDAKREKVVRVWLEGCPEVDEVMDDVARLPHLRALSLYGSSVTDADLMKLQGCKRLKSLGIGRTAITDRGLSSLERMSSLRQVYVTLVNDKLTDQGIASLQRALPGIQVHIQERTNIPNTKPKQSSSAGSTSP